MHFGLALDIVMRQCLVIVERDTFENNTLLSNRNAFYRIDLTLQFRYLIRDGNIEFDTFAIQHFNRNRYFTGSNDNNQLLHSDNDFSSSNTLPPKIRLWFAG